MTKLTRTIMVAQEEVYYVCPFCKEEFESEQYIASHYDGHTVEDGDGFTEVFNDGAEDYTIIARDPEGKLWVVQGYYEQYEHVVSDAVCRELTPEEWVKIKKRVFDNAEDYVSSLLDMDEQINDVNREFRGNVHSVLRAIMTEQLNK